MANPRDHAQVALGAPVRPPAHDVVAEVAEAHLGAPVARRLFTHVRHASTFGVELTDGRRAVVKLHPPDRPGADALAAAQRVQHHLVGCGFPCPAPLLGPTAAGGWTATAEALLAGGQPPDRRRRRDRRLMAQTLARIVRLCAPLGALAVLDAARRRELKPDVLWPSPHDPRLTFAPADQETAWIDDLGRRARRRRTAAPQSDPVVGHGDWHIEHLRIADGQVVAVYDWASAIRAPEPFLVGCAVGGFTADWSVDEPAFVPRASEMQEFLNAYERARERPFDASQRATVHAHWVEMTAYAARLEIAKRDAGLPSHETYAHRLREHGESLLC